MAKRQKEKRFNPNPGTTEFNGRLIGLIGWGLLFVFGSIFTLFIATPWIRCGYLRWKARHTKIDGRQLVFDGKGGQLFGKNIAWFFLGIITLTIFWWWVPVKRRKWFAKHTYLEKAACVATPAVPQQYAQPQCMQYPQFPQYPQYPQYSCCPMQQQYYYPCAPVYPQGRCPYQR